MRTIDDKPPGAICLPADHFGAHASRRSGYISHGGFENPITMQQSQIVVYHNC
jgi:hypothetical protein